MRYKKSNDLKKEERKLEETIRQQGIEVVSELKFEETEAHVINKGIKKGDFLILKDYYNYDNDEGAEGTVIARVTSSDKGGIVYDTVITTNKDEWEIGAPYNLGCWRSIGILEKNDYLEKKYLAIQIAKDNKSGGK
jgi:hypothetical protein